MDQKGRESFPSREQGEGSIARGNIWVYSGNWELFASARVWLEREKPYTGRNPNRLWKDSYSMLKILVFSVVSVEPSKSFK